MSGQHDHKKAFIQIFKETARYHHRYKVFSDFVRMAAISFENSMLRCGKLEEEYLSIVGQYEKDDVERMSKLLAEVVMGLEIPCDFLGSIFMELELGSGHVGQFFTPYDISKLMASIQFGNAENLLKGKPFITFSEPACGSGSTIIAFVELMYEKGLNPQKQLWVSCIDIDPLVAMMAYLQLSLLHIPAEVIVGNTLTLSFTKVMRTPAHYLGFWDSKLRNRLSDTDVDTDTDIEVEVEVEVEVEAEVIDDLVSLGVMAITEKGQLALFDVTA